MIELFAGMAVVGNACRFLLLKISRTGRLRPLETDHEQVPVLDITVRNRGEAAAVIHELAIDGVEMISEGRVSPATEKTRGNRSDENS